MAGVHMILLLLMQLWASYPNPTALLSGNWQSCKQDNGYGERVYDRYEIVNGKQKWAWSLHMGPYDEFGLYAAKDSPSGDHDHTQLENRLGPNYNVTQQYGRGRRTWALPSLGIWLNIVLAGGSREECESFFIL